MAQSRSNVSTTQWAECANESSDAQELTPSVFERDDPVSIARSLKHSADKSARRRTGPYRSAMSMLTFYINRAGKQLPAQRREVLEQAKDELRILYGKPRKGGAAG
ncbi:DUF3175 domain-containing protein [Xanthomonas translucens pv. graminis]|uniref:DUF3175 domain-containing protein n=1 Tax=Xanthomonas graminis TaxID=3390026 RepID=UPI00253FA040|nr:DUF3175 domain-containing protein [Xanthomonas translucens]WIH03771.1 DUF3175 domain-containing protein [Xanthomonas translucens pv. graminis]